MTAADRERWRVANRELIAKSIGELSYEQVFRPELEATGGYRLGLSSGAVYSFRAWRSVWDHLNVDPSSVRRVEGGDTAPAECAGTFFADCQAETGMTDIVLANFLEEMHNTLFSDVRLLEKQEAHPVEEIREWSGERIQSILGGHPKLLLNKGRMGWGCADLDRYSPESEGAFRLHWVAVREDRAVSAFGGGLDARAILAESLDAPEEARLLAAASRERARIGERGGFLPLPVHPWQWDRVARIQFGPELASGAILSLGEFGDEYRPQISLRTLSNVSSPGRLDLKLPLTILNTSSHRGIPSRYIAIAPGLSDSVAALCERDPALREARAEVLRDRAGVSFAHSVYGRVKGAPYRYHEQLGAVWRESAASKLAPGERAVLAGSLFYRDRAGKSLIGAFIERSGLSAEAWLKRYFERVVVPLYHLQLRYGIGLVAHGQNVVLRLREGRPEGVLLKDFQGDLRISERYDGPFADRLDRLPPEHLIHDLITGHLVTVLRFVSATLRECDGFDEPRFYAVLAEVVATYLRENGGAGRASGALDLLQERLHRVLVNRVRFRIGYADSAARPSPMLGDSLLNPLRASRAEKEARA